MARSRSRSREPEPVAQLRILFYHRVSDERDLLAVRPADFKRQMHLLAAEGYSVLDIATAWDRLRGGDAPARLLALSFDDGYRDFREHALPVLERLDFGATVFVCPGLIDGSASMSWYREQPPLLSWDEIAALDGELVRFEPHSISHPNLSAIDAAGAGRRYASRGSCWSADWGARRESSATRAVWAGAASRSS
jgi:peptidoglycan/xylan/chitin deacetylase (PgdA/CDA1 family)